jgi:hypothetical protein
MFCWFKLLCLAKLRLCIHEYQWSSLPYKKRAQYSSHDSLELARAEFELAIWLGSAILNSFESARLVCELSPSWLQLACGSLTYSTMTATVDDIKGGRRSVQPNWNRWWQQSRLEPLIYWANLPAQRPRTNRSGQLDEEEQ